MAAKVTPLALDRPIAWVCEVFEDDQGKTQPRVKREGMTRDEIIAHFPPANKGTDYNRAALVRSVVYEAYRETLAGAKRERGNIRSFWYERFMYLLRTVMGDTASQDSLDATINKAWGELIEGGWLTYADLNLHSEKDDRYQIAVVPDSPYPRVVVLVEKESLFEGLKDLADVYEISFCAAGGQASRAAAMTYCRRLAELGIALDQPFRVYSMCDFDPEGWDIPNQFIKHLRTGGISGEIDLIRLGVLREHLGDDIDRLIDVYPIDSIKSKAMRKAKQTKWDKWAAETGGILATDASGAKVPGRVELNIYTPSQIRERIIQGLCAHLDGFAYQVRALREAVEASHERALELAQEEARQDVAEAYTPFYEAIEDKTDEITDLIHERTADENKRISDLWAEISRVEEEKAAKTADLAAKLRQLDLLRVQLEEEQEQEFNAVWLRRGVDLQSPGELVHRVESNGGWRHFAESIGVVDRLATEDLIAFARQRQSIAWQLDEGRRALVARWARREIGVNWPAPTGPDDEPDELIDQALSAA